MPSHGRRLGLKVISITTVDVSERIPAASVPGYSRAAVLKQILKSQFSESTSTGSWEESALRIPGWPPSLPLLRVLEDQPVDDLPLVLDLRVVEQGQDAR